MRKMYFGKRGNDPAIYAVKLLYIDLEKFINFMIDYGFEKPQDLPEIWDCEKYEYGIAFTIADTTEKAEFEKAYKEYSKLYPTGKTEKVWIIQGNYAGNFEDVCEYSTYEYKYKDVKADLHEYNMSKYPHRIITRYEKRKIEC